MTPSCTQEVQLPVIRQTKQREQAWPRRNTQIRKHDTGKQGKIQNIRKDEKDNCGEKREIEHGNQGDFKEYEILRIDQNQESAGIGNNQKSTDKQRTTNSGLHKGRNS